MVWVVGFSKELILKLILFIVWFGCVIMIFSKWELRLMWGELMILLFFLSVIVVRFIWKIVFIIVLLNWKKKNIKLWKENDFIIFE